MVACFHSQEPFMETYPKFGKRHVLSIWLFTGFINVYILRVSINVAIVSMVNGTATEDWAVIDTNGTCPYPQSDNTTSPPKQGEFYWDHATQGVILSSFYYGYIGTQFIGGYLARVVGAKTLYGLGVGGTAALTLLNPVAARAGPEFLIALRAIEGFLEGFSFPSSHFILSNWAPKQERSLLVAFPFAGQNVGTILADVFTGLLCEYGFDGGWPSSFYIFGSIGVVWTIGWFYFISETPATHPTITPEERAYIEKHCQSTSKVASFRNVPWKSILLSPAVWSIVIAQTTYNWTFYTLLTEMSTYLKDVLHIGSATNGIITSIPYVCMLVVQIPVAFLADVLRDKGMKTKYVRKLYFSGGMIVTVVCLLAISYVGCNVTVVIILLCLSVGFCGFSHTGYIMNNVDIAPQYASIVSGISNTFATIPGIVSPILAGAITNQESSIATWQTVFFISVGVSGAGAILFAILGDGEVQTWALVSDFDSDDFDNECRGLLASSNNEFSSSKHQILYCASREQLHHAESSFSKNSTSAKQQH